MTVSGAVRAPALRLRSHYWVNLHHRLHAAARGDDTLEGVPWAAGAAWVHAVAWYRDTLAHRSLVFDSAMSSILHALAAPSTLLDPGPLPGPQGLREALVGAAGVYGRWGWADDNAGNTAWAEAQRPVLAAHGDVALAAAADHLGLRWTVPHVPVDVVVHSHPVGAYTVGDPPRVVISSAAPSTVGDLGLEILVHEALHAIDDAVVALVRDAIGDEAPPDLWHGLIFAAAGTAAGGVLGPDYVPYATRFGVYDRLDLGGRAHALSAEWVPARGSRSAAVAAIRAVVGSLTD